MSNKKENIIKIQVTTDLEIELDFSKKHLFVYSNIWKTKILKEQNGKAEKTIEDIPAKWTDKFSSNKKVRPSKAETQFDKFVQLFTLLDEMDTLQEGVSFQVIKKAVTDKGIAKEINEINNLINDAISKDVIEGTDKYGYYRLIKT